MLDNRSQDDNMISYHNNEKSIQGNNNISTFDYIYQDNKITLFDPVLLELFFCNSTMNAEEQSRFVSENQKWWLKQAFAIGMMKQNDIEIVKITLHRHFNPDTDVIISYKDSNQIVFSVQLIPLIEFSQAESSSQSSDMIVSSIEIVGNGASNIGRGIQIAFQTNMLRQKDIEEMIECSIFEQDNNLQMYQQIKPAL